MVTLMALVVMAFIFYSKNVDAASLSDGDRQILRSFVDSELARLQEKSNFCVNSYVVYQSAYHPDQYNIILSCDLIDIRPFDYEEKNQEMSASINCSRDGLHGFLCYRYVIGSGNTPVSCVYESDSSSQYALWGGAQGLIGGNRYRFYGLFRATLSQQIVACNYTIRSEDGTIFFVRTPLAANWLKIADQAIQEKLVEVRENRPHLPQLGQIQTGLIAVVCCLVSLILLNKLLRVWKRSVVR